MCVFMYIPLHIQAAAWTNLTMLCIVRTTVGRIKQGRGFPLPPSFILHHSVMFVPMSSYWVITVCAEWRGCCICCQAHKFCHVSNYSIVPSKDKETQFNCGSIVNHLFYGLNMAYLYTSKSTRGIDHLLNMLLDGNWLGKTKGWSRKIIITPPLLSVICYCWSP